MYLIFNSLVDEIHQYEKHKLTFAAVKSISATIHCVYTRTATPTPNLFTR